MFNAFLVERNRWYILPLIAFINLILSYFIFKSSFLCFIPHEPTIILITFSPTFYTLWFFRNQDKITDLERSNFVEFLKLAKSDNRNDSHMGICYLKSEMYNKNIFKRHTIIALISIWNSRVSFDFIQRVTDNKSIKTVDYPLLELFHWLIGVAKTSNQDAFARFCKEYNLAIKVTAPKTTPGVQEYDIVDLIWSRSKKTN